MFSFLAAVVVAFFICWAPFHIQRLLYVYGNKTDPTFRIVNEYLFHFSGIAYYMASTINPLLYNLISIKYRAAFKETLCGVRDTNRDTVSTRAEHVTARITAIRFTSNHGSTYINKIECKDTDEIEMQAVADLCRNHDETINELYRNKHSVTSRSCLIHEHCHHAIRGAGRSHNKGSQRKPNKNIDDIVDENDEGLDKPLVLPDDNQM